MPLVSSRWDQVGLQLGMSPECLKVIKREQFMELEDCCNAMFCKWMQKALGTGCKKRSWESVLFAVEYGHGTAAEEEIRKELSKIAAEDDYQAADCDDKVKTVCLMCVVRLYPNADIG